MQPSDLLHHSDQCYQKAFSPVIVENASVSARVHEIAVNDDSIRFDFDKLRRVVDALLIRLSPAQRGSFLQLLEKVFIMKDMETSNKAAVRIKCDLQVMAPEVASLLEEFLEVQRTLENGMDALPAADGQFA
jgi:hypothetical protein